MNDDVPALQRLGALVASGSLAALPNVRAAARLHVMDTVGAWVAATSTAEGRALIGLRRQMNAQSSSGGSLFADCWTHCGMTRLSEVDDIHLASMVTPGAMIVPSALVAGTAVESDPRLLVEAIVAGYEVMVRIGLALDGPTILYRGIWPTYFTGAAGVAAMAARLWGLTDIQTAHAIALALTMAPPGVGQQSSPTTSRWFAVGTAARTGATAAMAAQHGFTSDLRLFEGPFYSGIYGITPDREALTEGLGETPAILRTSYKGWCAARQTMAAAHGMFDLVRTSGLAPSEIGSVEAFVLPPHLRMIDHGVIADDRISHLTSLPFQMAIGALQPREGWSVNHCGLAEAEPVRTLMGKVRVTPDDKLMEDYPQIWPARIVVTMKDGTIYERIIKRVPGDPGRPCDLNQKFRFLVGPVVGEAVGADLLALASRALDDPEAPARLLRAIEQIYADASPLEGGEARSI